MLSALRRCFALIKRYRGIQWILAGLPQKDPETYTMISHADTIGVFQIESRAQMSMLPRLLPQTFYDMVIQGDMVHPYLRRRNGEEPVEYPSEELRLVFQRTLGAVSGTGDGAGHRRYRLHPGAADKLRRNMAAWKRHGGLKPYRQRLTSRMLEKGYTPAFTERIFRQIEGFGSYGFPESHAPASPCSPTPTAGSHATSRQPSPAR